MLIQPLLLLPLVTIMITTAIITITAIKLDSGAKARRAAAPAVAAADDMEAPSDSGALGARIKHVAPGEANSRRPPS